MLLASGLCLLAPPAWGQFVPRARGEPSRVREHVRALSVMGRLAGSESAHRAADHLLSLLAGYGLDTTRQRFPAFVPYQDSVVVERLEPQAMASLPLRLLAEEPPLPSDSPAVRLVAPPILPYSGRGDVRGPLVYVNYGRPADLALLDSLGRSLRGAVALARIGRVAPGVVAGAVAERGASALLLYGDPMDDGFMRGDPSPAGPMRHPDAITRMSVAPSQGDGTAAIPVAMIGFRNALAVFSFLAEGDVPDAWQGGLPFRYHSGPGEVAMRVGVWAGEPSASRRPLENVLATLRGASAPGELVVVGAHRDAWGAGAADNAGGLAVLLEVARLLAAEAAHGRRLRRTVVFAAWDGGLWERAGSRAWLAGGAAGVVTAYVNLDEVVTGTRLSVRAAPELRALAREVAHAAGMSPDAAPFDGPRWHESDDESFRRGRGAPALQFAFTGPQGLTGSSYDTPDWVERFADPGYVRHAAAVDLVASAVRRLADDAVLPLAPLATAGLVRGALDSLRASTLPGASAVSWKDLGRSLGRFEHAVADFEARRREAGAPVMDTSLVHALGAFAGDAGHVLEDRDMSDHRTVVSLPRLRAALASGNPAAATAAATDLTARLDEARERLRRAMSAR